MSGRAGRTVADPTGGASLWAVAARVRHDVGASVGQPLDGALRGRMEARLAGTERALPAGAVSEFQALEAAADRAAGAASRPRNRPPSDFSSVRLHTDGHAESAARRLGASAFTIGEHVYADRRLLPVSGTERDGLMAHELGHVLQQRALRRTLIQPRLIATGDEGQIIRFMKLAQTALGKELAHDPATGQITPGKALAQPATSARFASMLLEVMTSPQDAEVYFGPRQPKVFVGGFPKSGEHRDMTTETKQRVDMNHVEKVESEAPGSGLAALAHEIYENYQAHGRAPMAGVDLFAAAHKSAIEVESDIAEELIEPGRRVAEAMGHREGTIIFAYDFQTYYLVVAYSDSPDSDVHDVKGARRVVRAPVLERTIAGFEPKSVQIPQSGVGNLNDVVKAMAANPFATVRVQGFTDIKEAGVGSVLLSYSRADIVANQLAAMGVEGTRISRDGKGRLHPVSAFDPEEGLAASRRVVMTVEQPVMGQKK